MHLYCVIRVFLYLYLLFMINLGLVYDRWITKNDKWITILVLDVHKYIQVYNNYLSIFS